MTLMVLVVDDEVDVEPLFRQRFRRDVRAGRFDLAFARSGEEALAVIEDATEVTLVLIFTDVNMPGMSGLELLPRARAARPDVPVIIVTAYGDAATEHDAFDKGAAGFLVKPIDFALVAQEIDKSLEVLR
ncbi:response regulator [Acuticoccus sediminis]|uniref:Response regulator n=1 Tax=Acuticoccus sediminis TaxID=2184697 RepID=A0A8B2NP31_9HYPH|nr:response regulator [Acuticoccus sediminis]RAI01646.1 response regulator [Acuticoccus sediminis]